MVIRYATGRSMMSSLSGSRRHKHRRNREATIKPTACLVVAASLCVGVGVAQAQSAFFLRLAPPRRAG